LSRRASLLLQHHHCPQARPRALPATATETELGPLPLSIARCPAAAQPCGSPMPACSPRPSPRRILRACRGQTRPARPPRNGRARGQLFLRRPAASRTPLPARPRRPREQRRGTAGTAGARRQPSGLLQRTGQRARGAKKEPLYRHRQTHTRQAPTRRATGALLSLAGWQHVGFAASSRRPSRPWPDYAGWQHVGFAASSRRPSRPWPDY